MGVVQVPVWHAEMTSSSWGGRRGSEAGTNLKNIDELEKLVRPQAIIKGDVMHRVACLAVFH